MSSANLGGIQVGPGFPTRVIGAVNISPESFYKGSVHTTRAEIEQTVRRMTEEGAHVIDLGGMSTAPYLQTQVPMEEERRRLTEAVALVKQHTSLPISADTRRSQVAEAAINAGASILNDTSGLRHDRGLVELAKEYNLPIIILASEEGLISTPSTDTVISRVSNVLKESLELAYNAGVTEDLVLDPGIGFFRGTGSGVELRDSRIPWYVWDSEVLKDLEFLRELGRPICIGLSRKSFIGNILNIDDPADRLYGSLAATAIAVFHGAHLIRTHDVAATVQAIKVAEAIRGK